MHLVLVVAAILIVAAPSPIFAATFRIATWNLGWHVSQPELSSWIAQCSKTFAKDALGKWRLAPAGTSQAKRGWEITESRADVEGVDLSVMPPCNVYLTPGFDGIEVTSTAYAKRTALLARLLGAAVRPDVIAFQEVSGTLAVVEALGPAAPDYYVCSFDGAYKIQRLAFAWKRTLGSAAQTCSSIHALSLPTLPKQQQVRPGYIVTLELAGKRIRFMTVHLKSGCVTPKDGNRLDDNSGPADPCPILQQQIAPFEEVFESLAAGVDHFVVLGDFNRNLWHEANLVAGAEAIRSDGATDLKTPRAATVRTRNLLLEVNDTLPTASEAVLLSVVCAGRPEVTAACEKSKIDKLSGAEAAVLTANDGLGCRNPVGLDHVLVSKTLAPAVRSTSKISIGPFGRSLSARLPEFPDPLLAVSDHCPIVVEVEL